MFDIEKSLSELKNKEDNFLGEDLRLETRRLIKSTLKKKKRRPVLTRPAAIFSYMAVVLALIAVLVFSPVSAEAAGYYTVDINPSINVAVDGQDTVIFVSAGNEDASVLLSGLNLSGMPFEDALKLIIESAKQQSYLKEDGHILVARFGEGGLTQERLDEIVGEEASGIDALLISGGRSDYEKAQKDGESAGIKLLLSNAQKQGIAHDNVDEVIAEMHDKSDKEDKEDKTIDDSDKSNNGNNGTDKDNNGNNNPGVDKGKKDNDAAADDNIKNTEKPDNPGNSGNKNDKDNNGVGKDKLPAGQNTDKKTD